MDLGLLTFAVFLSIGLSTIEVVRDKGPNNIQIIFSSFILKGLSPLLQKRDHV